MIPYSPHIHPWDVDITIIPHLQMKQMKLRDIHWLTQDHVASKARVKTQGNYFATGDTILN